MSKRWPRFPTPKVFSTPMLTQSQIVSRLDVPIVADIDVEAGKLAYRKARASAF